MEHVGAAAGLSEERKVKAQCEACVHGQNEHFR